MNDPLEDTGAAARAGDEGAPAFLAGLNDAQRQAVEHEGGPLVVLAGPGTGKTRVIVHRVARLIAPGSEGGLEAPPESVLALAFTIKSAEEMRERLAEVAGGSAATRVHAGTCHAFGRSLVRRFGDLIGLPARTRIVDTAVRRRLLRELMLEHALMTSRIAEGRENAITETMAFVDRCHNDAVTPQRAAQWIEQRQAALDRGDADPEDAQAERARLVFDRDCARLFALYEDARLARGMLTLGDYITLPLRILRESPEAAAIIQAELRHIVVDEFQDWNPAQIELLKALAPLRTASGRPPDLCVVGDDDQSIYAFRGADDRAFERFSAHWQGHATIALIENYRSDPVILTAAAHTISLAEHRFAQDKVVRPAEHRERLDGGSLEGVLLTDDHDAGTVIASMILVDRRENNRPWSSYAVLARTTNHLNEIADDLRLHGVPVSMRERLSPLDDPGVQDLMAWMRLLVDPSLLAPAQRLLVRPPALAPVLSVQAWSDAFRRARIGGDERPFLDWLSEREPDSPHVRAIADRLPALRDAAMTKQADGAVFEIVRQADLVHAEALPPQERARRIEHLVQVMKFIRGCAESLDAPGDLRAFMQHYDDLDQREQRFESYGDERVETAIGDEDDQDAVSLLTAHKAKGLEFDTVFVARVRPGHGFPKSGEGADDTLPESLTGRPAPNKSDEERRLFYVAATRAKRRLALLAKNKKSRGKATDYFIEIQDAVGADPASGGMAETAGEAWIERANVERAEGRQLAEGQRVDRWLVDEGLLARQRAAAILHRLDRGDVREVEVRAAQQELALEAERVAAIAGLRHARKLPDFVRTGDPALDPLRELEARVQRGDARGSIVRPMRAPLSLSYSKVKQYMDCPRCFYMKYVLRWDEEKTSGLTVGNVVHAAIAKFLERVRLADSEGVAPPTRDDLLAIGEHICVQDQPDSRPLDPELSRRVAALLEIYHEQFFDPSAEVLIIEGVDQDADDDHAVGARTEMRIFPYATADAPDVFHRFDAKPDCVHRLPGGGFRIIDYKTGYASKALTQPDKNDLQLSVYAIALQAHFEMDEPPRGVAEYWVLSTGDCGSIDLEDLRLDKAREKIDAAAHGMLAGEFPQGSDRACKGMCALLREG